MTILNYHSMLALLLPLLNKEKVKANNCGHLTDKNFVVASENEKRIYLYFNAVPPFCPDCLKKSVITCNSCGRPIFPFENINFYYFKREKNKKIFLLKNSRRFEKAIIICCRRSCSFSYDAVWTPSGVKFLFKKREVYKYV